jgi:hypothetical protein
MAADQVGGGIVDAQRLFELTGEGLCLLLAASTTKGRAWSDRAHSSSSSPNSCCYLSRRAPAHAETSVWQITAMNRNNLQQFGFGKA